MGLILKSREGVNLRVEVGVVTNVIRLIILILIIPGFLGGLWRFTELLVNELSVVLYLGNSHEFGEVHGRDY